MRARYIENFMSLVWNFCGYFIPICVAVHDIAINALHGSQRLTKTGQPGCSAAFSHLHLGLVRWMSRVIRRYTSDNIVERGNRGVARCTSPMADNAILGVNGFVNKKNIGSCLKPGLDRHALKQ